MADVERQIVLDIAKYLIDTGNVQANAKNEAGLTALDVATARGKHELALYLAQCGASFCETPYNIDNLPNTMTFMHYLVKQGAELIDSNARNVYHMRWGHHNQTKAANKITGTGEATRQIFKHFIKLGSVPFLASVHTFNQNGLTPLHLLCRLFTAWGARSEDDEGNKELHAFLLGQIELAQMLVEVDCTQLTVVFINDFINLQRYFVERHSGARESTCQ